MTREQRLFRLLNRSAFSRPEKIHPKFQPEKTPRKTPGFLKPLLFSLFSAMLLTAPSGLNPQMIATIQPFEIDHHARICDGSCNCPDCPVFFEQLNAQLNAQLDPVFDEKQAVLTGVVAGNQTLPANLSLPPATIAQIAARQDAVYLMGPTESGGQAVFVAAENPAVFVF